MSGGPLGLTGATSAPTARAAFRRFVLEAHPDRGGDAERFAAAVEEYRRWQGRRRPGGGRVEGCRRHTWWSLTRRWVRRRRTQRVH